MAIGTPVSLGTPVTGTASQTTTTLVTTTGVSAGDRIILAVGTSGGTVSSVSDGTGNTYAVDRTHSNGTANVHIVSAPVTTTVPSGSSIVVTHSASDNRRSLAAFSVSGLAASGAVDKVASATQFGVAAWSSGATATTTQADELVFGASVMQGVAGTSTPGGSN